MKFVKTYEDTPFDSFYKPYYYIDNKRVSKDKFELLDTKCKVLGKFYNCSSLVKLPNNRYKSTYYYNDYMIR